MELARFTRSCRKLSAQGHESGSVSIEDVEQEIGVVEPEVFHDVLRELRESGVVITGADDVEDALDGRTGAAPGRRSGTVPDGVGNSGFARPLGLISDQIYYREVGRLPLLDRDGEIRLARRRVRLQSQIASALSRSLPVADAFLESLRAVASEGRRAGQVVEDPPRPTAPSGRGRPKSLVSRINSISRARKELLLALQAGGLDDFGGSVSRPVLRARLRLSRAVIAANPVLSFWDHALYRLCQTVDRLLLYRDQAAVELLNRRARPDRPAGVISPVPFHYDDLSYLLRIRRRVKVLRDDLAAVRNEFAEANLRLVSLMAQRRRRLGATTEVADLVQSGNVGLLRAVDRFDADRGCKFSTYATWWIRQAISRHDQETGMEIRVPVHLADLARRVRGCERDWRIRTGDAPSADDVATTLGVPVTDVVRVQTIPSPVVSLQDSLRPDSDGNVETLGARVADQGAEDPEEAYGKRQLRLACARVLSKILTPVEEQIIRRAFGLPLRSGVDVPKFTAAQERDIEAGAMEKLRGAAGREALAAFADLAGGAPSAVSAV